MKAARRPSVTHLAFTAGQFDHWGTKAGGKLALAETCQEKADKLFLPSTAGLRFAVCHHIQPRARDVRIPPPYSGLNLY